MRLLVCGNRDWTCEGTIRAWLTRLERTIKYECGETFFVINGGAPGVDQLSSRIARMLGAEVDEYTAHWELQGTSAGPIRNRRMLADGKPDRCIAFGALFRGAKLTGTGDMVKCCNDAGLLVTLVSRPGLVP